MAINPHTNESFALDLFDNVPEFARLVFNQRRDHDDFCLRLVGENLIDDLLGRLPVKWSPRQRIMRLTDCRIKHAQIIVRFRRGRDCRSRIRAGAALLDSDGRGKTLDEIDIRLFHLIEELPRVSRETFDVTPLPFGIKRIEGERRFPRAAQPRNDHQFLTWDIQVEVLQIVLARTTDLDDFSRHLEEKRRTFYLNTMVSFLQRICCSCLTFTAAAAERFHNAA